MANLVKLSKKEYLKQVIYDPDRKSLNKMISDIFTLMLFHKRFPKHYFSKYLYKKYITNIKDYYSEEFLYYKLKPLLNEQALVETVENKLFFDFYYSQFNLRLPKIHMYNHLNMFVKENEKTVINNISDFKKQLESIFMKNPSYDSLIVKKTYGSNGGDQVYKIYHDQLSTDEDTISQLYKNVIKTGFLFQETIKQHPELNRLNPASLNTIRFDTFIDKEGKVEIISAYLRMGTNKAHVDNISSGGCQVGIWLQSGKMKRDGFSSYRSSGTKVYKRHPLTGIVFEDFKIPFFNEAKELIIKTAGCMPGLRLVGWDVAIGESEPVLIEGNSDYAMSGNDMSEGGYRTNATFRKILHELNYL